MSFAHCFGRSAVGGWGGAKCILGIENLFLRASLNVFVKAADIAALRLTERLGIAGLGRGGRAPRTSPASHALLITAAACE